MKTVETLVYYYYYFFFSLLTSTEALTGSHYKLKRGNINISVFIVISPHLVDPLIGT